MRLEIRTRQILDPGLKTVLIGFNKDLVVVDDAGNSLKPERQVMPAVPNSASRYFDEALTFVTPNDVKKLSKFSGSIMEYASHAPQTWTLKDLTKADSHAFGNMLMKISQVDIRGCDVFIYGSVHDIPMPLGREIENSVRREMSLNLMSRMMDVTSGDGKEDLTNVMSEVQEYEPNSKSPTHYFSFKITMRTKSGAEVVNPVIKATFPTRFSEIWIPFDFKDVQLP